MSLRSIRLRATTASTAALPALTARLGAQGIAVATLDREQARTKEWQASIVELLRATGPERVANPYGVGATTEFLSAEVAANIWEASQPLCQEATFLAHTDEQYVGLSFLSEGSTAGHVAVQGETAVHADWRRRGIATLLKLHTIAYARAHGYAEITTRTASPGMRALNEGLGFVVDGAEIRLVRTLRGA